MTDDAIDRSGAHEPRPPAVAPAPARAPKHRRPVLLAGGVLVAVAAALLISSLAIDLGPALRHRAETAGSSYLDRPMRIGRLSIRLLSGAFEVDDLLIEGLKPGDRPFLRAKRVFVYLPWWTIFTHELIVDHVDMSDWDMLVEQFENGRHNFPRVLGPPRTEPRKPPRFKFTTTLNLVVARRGRFTYDDHGAPWRVVCPNLDVQVFKGRDGYRGTAAFSDGRVRIQTYEEFRADMQTRFRIVGGKVLLEDINLQSTGASTKVTGYVDLGHWPDMLYNVKSRIDFPTQKRIYFKTLNFSVTGSGDFTGTFRFFRTPSHGTGRELRGSFTSPEAGVNGWRFPNARGELLWTNTAFRVTDVTTGLYGGHATLDFLMEPFGQPARPAQAIWDARYVDVDLAQVTDFLEVQGIRLAGRATGSNRLEWPVGKFSGRHGHGEITAAMPPGSAPMTRQIPPDLLAAVDQLPPEVGPFNPALHLGHVPVAGHVTYTLDPDWIKITSGWASTEKTYVEFSGQTAWGRDSAMPFHVTSVDWQESDRLLAGIMTAFGSKTGATPMNGRGTFDGTMRGTFGSPRIEGRFTGERMRAWDVLWGNAAGDLVIENSYVTVKNGVITSGDSRIDADGTFSLGYPRRDNGEQINAVVRVAKRPLADLRRAFGLADYPIDGLVSGEFHLYGNYTHPDGVGRLEIDAGTAYGERFDAATANMRFEHAGVRMDAIDLKKSSGGLTGAAWIAWDGSYTFEADGRKIPLESLVTLQFPRAPLSGLMQFKASGAGTFAVPRYDVKIGLTDVYAADEGIGDIRGTLSLRGEMLTLSDFDASSKRLSVSGAGRLALTPEKDVDLSLRFSDTSIDPYLRFFLPQSSPFNSIVADGTLEARGELSDIDHLLVTTEIERLQLKLFDYAASNDGPIRLALNNHVVEVRRFTLKGEHTALELSGSVGLHNREIALDAVGNANLAILQAFYADSIRSSGSVSLRAQVRGALDKPVFSGDATVSGGRIRYVPLPHSLEEINARLVFDAQGIRIVDAASSLGGGLVRLDGRIGLRGFQIDQVDLTARGQQMQLRYPEGFRSTVDAELTLRGDPQAMVLGGTVTIDDGVYGKDFQPNVDAFSLASAAAGGGEPAAAPAESPSLPLRYDIKVSAPGTLRLENNLARIGARADLTLNGTYDHPALFGRADIEHGEIIFEGNRYRITRGTIDFVNPARIEPFFDIEAEGRIHAPGIAEPYRVTLAVSGTLDGHMNLELNSDPPLPTVSIVGLVFGTLQGNGGDIANPLTNPELSRLNSQAATQSEEQLLKMGVLRVLAGGITGSVGRAVEQTLGIDTVQISPNLGTSSADPLTPTARLILGTRISSRAYLTFSRALGTTTHGGDQIVILEYDQSDLLSWVLTQNGANTFAIDFRFRRTF